MGMFATVFVSSGIDLPYMPSSVDYEEMSWQSKQGLDVYSGPYRITEEGRLERKEKSAREKTYEEKDEEAKRWGFESWEDYTSAYEDYDGGLVPESVDYEEGKEHPPTVYPSETTVDEIWWADHNMHGTFEFHRMMERNPTKRDEMLENNENTSLESSSNLYVQYEARFTKGDLDDIVLVGERGSDETLEETIKKIKELGL